MARILGVDIPGEKRIDIALRYIYGIGPVNAKAIIAKAGIDPGALAAQLQDEGARSFVKSWNELMTVIAAKSATLAKAG